MMPAGDDYDDDVDEQHTRWCDCNSMMNFVDVCGVCMNFRFQLNLNETNEF